MSRPAAPPAPRRRLSLRARLLVAFLVPTVVVLALVGLVSTTALRHQLVDQVDERLQSAGYRATEAAQGYGAPPPAPPSVGDDDEGDEGDGDGDGDGGHLGSVTSGQSSLAGRST